MAADRRAGERARANRPLLHPADFLLLLEGTGLALQHIEVDGQTLDMRANNITTSGPLMQAWCYLVQLLPES